MTSLAGQIANASGSFSARSSRTSSAQSRRRSQHCRRVIALRKPKPLDALRSSQPSRRSDGCITLNGLARHVCRRPDEGPGRPINVLTEAFAHASSQNRNRWRGGRTRRAADCVRRRRRGSVVAAVATTRVGDDAARAGTSANPVQVENARAGTKQWRIRLVPQHALEGYASEVSVAPGQALHLHVSSASRLRYHVLVFRIGWYEGTGGRPMPCTTCRVHRASSERIRQPDEKTGLLRLAWPVTDVVRVGTSWVSGYYLAELVVRSGPLAGRGSGNPFVVRELRSRRSAILVQAAVNTVAGIQRVGRPQPLLEPHGDRRRPRLVRPALRDERRAS